MTLENKKLTKYLSWLVVLLWMGLIFYFSHQVQQQSWNLSYSILGISIQAIKVFQVFLFIGLAGFAIFKLKNFGFAIGLKEVVLILVVAAILYSLSLNVRHALVPVDLHHFICKNAHFFIYLILGVSVKNALNSSGLKGIKAFGIGLLICVGYAFSDEVHQLVVPGRGGQLSDVVIDSYGAGVGILLQTVVVTFRSNGNKNKVVENS